jgi:2-oxoglutarate dehydrogenase E1 component
LLLEGISVRLSGQDCGRGTFSHRHAALDNYLEAGGLFLPLRSLNTRIGFEVINSVLSEAAVLGFEFGYSSVVERSLVLWEGQFGDFVNGAQVCVDQFICSAEEKWDQRSGVVLLLPHGYEGAGPEHSSARLERFLQLCSDGNMDVCVPSSAAQYFHMLRRQVYSAPKRPLIVMTPKSLLRLPAAADPVSRLVTGRFEEVIRTDFGERPNRLLFMSGKIYYDLLNAFKAEKFETLSRGVSLIRLEQLHPFPFSMIRELIDQLGADCSLAWVQEEPKNQGGWSYVETRFINRLTKEIRYIGRPDAASTATGSSGYHQVEQRRIVEAAIGFAKS